MDNETSSLGLGSSLNVGDTNVKLIRIVAEWWRSAKYLQENSSRFEPNELEAFEYILNTPARGEVDEDRFGLAVNLIREISYQTTDQFGAEASNFAGKSSKILKDIHEFSETLESQKLKASADVSINRIRTTAAGAIAGNTASKGGESSSRRTIKGNTWEGTFDQDGNPYGSGSIFYADGSIYSGQWSAAGPHGNGRIVQADGDVWEAIFRDGKPVDGKIRYSNGNRYEGGLNENGRNGIGRTFTDKYEEYGQYADDSRTGRGKIVFSNGDFYEGGWNDKGPHGRGTLFDSVNKRTDTGDFLNGKRSGSGRMVWANTSTCYEGTWRDTPRGMEGEGVTYVLPNGPRTPIRYMNGKPVQLSRVAQPPFNPNIRRQEPQVSATRKFFGIVGGIIFGFLVALYFVIPEMGAAFVCAIPLIISQFIYPGKFDRKTGRITRRGIESPIGITGLMFILCGFVELCDTASFLSILALIIGIIDVIIQAKK